jgi:thiamine transport system substrate-binding protein
MYRLAKRLAAAGLCLDAIWATTACTGSRSQDGPADGAKGKVTLITHGSFALSEPVIAQFEAETGLELEVLPADDAGAMVNQLILTREAPLADAVFGIDNTFASRAIEEGILEPYTSPAAGAEQTELTRGLDGQLTAIDFSDVCVNADLRAVPEGADLTFADLSDERYKDQLVVQNPATSSPGLAFLLATIAAHGEDGWLDYWKSLKANGVRIVSGWEEAYYQDFSGPSSQGARPLVVSYASSPPAEADPETGQPVTAAALGTCFRQVEYAGVLRGAANPAGAKLLVDFLLSEAVQRDLPASMWVYPAVADTPLPEDWVRLAPLSDGPWLLSPGAIATYRDEWLETFNDQILG